MMDLDSRRNNTYEKTDIDLGLDVLCSSNHRVLFNTHAHTSFTHTTAHSRYASKYAASFGGPKAKPL
jgi:hypothetical protein